MSAKRDYVLGIGLLVFAGAYWFGANSIPESSIDAGIGVQALPKALAYALAVLSAVLLLQARFSAAPSVTTVEDGGLSDAPGTHLRAFGIIVIATAYLLLLPYLGYAASLFLMMTATALFMGRSLSWKLAAIMLGGATFYWLLFVKLLNVPMPVGIVLPGGIGF